MLEKVEVMYVIEVIQKKEPIMVEAVLEKLHGLGLLVQLNVKEQVVELHI